ncbi:unnamed protein product [Orchesella dallaii]|uniref:HTH La-type RNA-binding domain-containing protein n=1 Tax=Orchesella dallaii TaxID=48710 RepID=A0ABP1QB15_9HEXA
MSNCIEIDREWRAMRCNTKLPSTYITCHLQCKKAIPYIEHPLWERSETKRIVDTLGEVLEFSKGRAYMNGEVGSTTAAFAGEESIPAMVLQVPTSAGAGTFADNRTLNGMKDGNGMPREQMKSIESNEVENADNSRHSDPGNGANATSSDMPKEELKRLLLQQLEYYFSPENLANDKFLVSQMDSDHYVFISTLANFNMVKKLTGDIDLVTEVLRESKNVQVHSDGKRVRPVSHRTVVILRGIPESTPVDEIKALFDSENCPKCNSCEFAFNDSWYVSFESDEDAQRAHRYLREDVKEFKGQPIMARIKSRPTTLLAQGAGVHGLKNGFHQPTQVMGTFIPPAFVPGSQTGPTTAVAPTPMYAHGHGQTVPPVFSLPPNYSYSPWPSFFGMAPEQISQMYPLNGIPPQHQSSSTYPKSLPMNQRPRNPNQVRPRRPPPTSSDNQGINGVVGAGGTGSAVAAHQSYGNPPRKTNNPPPPLLNLVPNPPTLPLVNPTTHNHSQSHMTHSSVQVSGAAISQNGRHFNSLPSSHNVDSYHNSGSMRPYPRGGVGDSRPRSSLSNRKGPPRRDEEGSYDGPSASPSLSAKVPSTRGAPPTAPVAQPPIENIGPHPHQGKLNFDLEGSAFPPLPGSGQSAGKNGDAMFEGRLSDVVKGVKNLKSTSSEKDDAKPSAGNAPTEIVVSAEENHNFGDVREVSAASPVKDLEVDKKPEHSSSQNYVQSGKKEFREVGVGSADDTHDIRSSHHKSNVVSGAKGKETADKSTRTDEALLNGDQSQGIVTLKAGGASNSSSQTSVSQYGGNRKSTSQSTSSKSPIPGKRAVPALQVQNASSVGPEVPYSSRNVTSPVATPAKISTIHSTPGGGNVGSNTGNSAVGRGANAYVAKPNMDNNNSRANGTVSNNNGSNLTSVDKDAFPSPGFGKSVPTCKPFPVSTDQISKEVRTDVEKERKESGQGDGKKGDDCSNDERDGPVRLSYAQVAQARKDAVAVSNSSSHTSVASNNVHTASSPNSTSVSHNFSTDEKKKPNPKDTKDPRVPTKNQRGGGGGDRDRDRGFRRGYRNRMMSDHSDGGSGTSGDSSRRLPKPSRSPK